MALMRKSLKAMGLTDEQVDSIVEMHTETVDGLKADIAKYKGDAEKLPSVQKELDDLKAKGDDGWKDKHDKLKKQFEDYKTEITSKESRAAKEKAARAYYESKGITGKNLELAMRGSRTEVDGLELDGEKIKDEAALKALVEGDFSGLVTTTQKKGASTATPPANTGTGAMTKEQILAIADRTKRREAIAQNLQLFGKGETN